MAESLLICNPQTNKIEEGFQRRIEFHIARKPFSAYYTSNNSKKIDGNFHLETLNPSSDSKRPGSSMAATAAGKKSDGGESAEHGWLDPELSFGITFRRIGAGLANLGNTCFLNSVLQCLTYTEPFAAYLQSGKHKSSCHTAGFCAMCAIQNHVSSALQSTGKILSPSHLVKNLRCISRNFRNSRQEDAHEYMVNLLESMHKCCLPSGVPSESQSAYEKSLVHKIFGGRLRSQVKCMQCSYCSNTFDPFLDLSLEIVKADSLCKALAHFTAMEQLDGGAKQYQCQRCKEKVKALKQLTLHKAPYVLTIHLKRFGSDDPGQKINKKVDFGPTLDLKPFVSDPYEGDLKYTLYGVLVHAGYSTHSGHYYCFVRTSSGMWHTLDDNRVYQVSEKTVLQQKAYMLFYVRDRRSSAPKKPLDLVHKGHTAANGSTQNKGFLVSTSITKQTIQHSLMERRLSTSVVGAASVGSLSKEASVLQTSIQVVAEGLRPSDLSKEPVTGLPLKDPLSKQPSLKNPLSSVDSSQNDHSGFQNHSPAKKLPKENGFHEIADVIKKREPNDRLCKANNLKPEKIGSPLLSHQSGIGNGCINKETLSASPTQNKIPDQNGSIVNGRSSSELSSKNSGDSDPKETGSLKLSSQKEALGRKPKPKKLTKCHLVKSINAGGKLLLFSSLGLRKRKKHKRTKHHGLSVRNFSPKDLMEGFISRDQGTSTSARFVDVDNGNGRGAPKGVEFSNDSTVNLKERDLGAGSGQYSAVLATNGSGQKFSLSIEPNDRENRGSFQCGLMSILTRGLEVARWDDGEMPSSEMYGTLDAPNIGIGYIPDEWDEEYDRGKRKKVRKSSEYCGGHNPFQEIATMKAQSKKMKTDQNSSGNRPFRI